MKRMRRLRWNPFIFLRNMILLAVIFVLMAGVALSGESKSASSGQVVVRQGDTLWAIALRHRPESDPRKTVYEITRLNALDSKTLRPGMVLSLPARMKPEGFVSTASK